MAFCLSLKNWVNVLVKTKIKARGNHRKKLLDYNIQFATDALKTASKSQFKKQQK